MIPDVDRGGVKTCYEINMDMYRVEGTWTKFDSDSIISLYLANCCIYGRGKGAHNSKYQ